MSEKAVNTIAEKGTNTAKNAVKSIFGNKYVQMGIQIFGGLVVVYILYVLFLIVMKSDKLYIDNKYDKQGKREVLILDGLADTSIGTIIYSTSLPGTTNYLPIHPSVNIKGGAQFTYSFWLYVGDGATDVANKCLFLRGDPNAYDVKITSNNFDAAKKQMMPSTSYNIKERLVYCPMFCFGETSRDLVIWFNTLNNMREKLEINPIKSDNNIYRNNITSMMTNMWTHICIVFQDNMPINDFENGIEVRFYFNDVLYSVGKFASTLRQNDGNFYLFPDSIIGCKMSDFKYWNYALSDNEVRKLASTAPSQNAASSLSKTIITSSMTLGDYNKLDWYN